MKESIMQVRLAEHLGMCFGLRDAIDLALDLTSQGPLTILGDLVHNPDVVAQIDAAGAVRVQRPEDIGTPSVLLTAHGVGPGASGAAPARPRCPRRHLPAGDTGSSRFGASGGRGATCRCHRSAQAR